MKSAHGKLPVLTVTFKTIYTVGKVELCELSLEQSHFPSVADGWSTAMDVTGTQQIPDK